MRYPAMTQGRATRQMSHITNMFRTHDPRVIQSHVHEQAIQVHVLLRKGIDEIMKMMAGDRQHRLSIELGIIQAIKQMNSSGAGGGEAHPEFAGIFRITAGHERRGFFVPHLDKADFVLAFAKRFHNPVNAIAWQAKNDFHSPFLKHLDQNICRRLTHIRLLRKVTLVNRAARR